MLWWIRWLNYHRVRIYYSTLTSMLSIFIEVNDWSICDEAFHMWIPIFLCSQTLWTLTDARPWTFCCLRFQQIYFPKTVKFGDCTFLRMSTTILPSLSWQAKLEVAILICMLGIHFINAHSIMFICSSLVDSWLCSEFDDICSAEGMATLPEYQKYHSEEVRRQV